jgi:hypothetical protein
MPKHSLFLKWIKHARISALGTRRVHGNASRAIRALKFDQVFLGNRFTSVILSAGRIAAPFKVDSTALGETGESEPEHEQKTGHTET